MGSRNSRWSWAALSLLGLGWIAPPTSAQAPKPEELLAVIRSHERAAASGRLALSVTERRGPYLSDETLTTLRDRLARDRGTLAEGQLLYSRDGWVKDLVVPSTRGALTPSRTRTGNRKGVLRILVETTHEGAARRFGRITFAPTMAPGDAALSRQIAAACEGIQWTSAEMQAGRVVLKGTREEERHTLELKPDTPPALLRWELVRTLTGPSGEKQSQTYACEIQPGATPGSVSRLEEWVVNPPPAGHVAHRVTVLRPLEEKAEVTPADLAVRFPAGALVTDGRGEIPVEYEQTEEGEEELAARAVAGLAAGRVGVGDLAPEFRLQDLRGKPLKLEGFRGKPLVLYWFSPRSGRAREWAALVRELHSEYGKRGVVFLGLAVGADANEVEEAREFRRVSRWDFSVALDAAAEGVRRYGTVIATPKVAVLDRTGRILYVQAGLDPDGVVRALEAEVGKKRD